VSGGTRNACISPGILGASVPRAMAMLYPTRAFVSATFVEQSYGSDRQQSTKLAEMRCMWLVKRRKNNLPDVCQPCCITARQHFEP